jgi:hypothetical protein
LLETNKHIKINHEIYSEEYGCFSVRQMKLREIEFNKRFKQYHFDNDESDCEEGK